MSTHKYFDYICVAVIIFALLLTVLFINGEALGIQKIIDEDAEGAEVTGYFTKNDEKSDWDREGATYINLVTDDADVSGDGAYVLNGDVIIAQEGKYVLSGTLESGSIVVEASKGSKVWIALDGVTINCPDNACLIVQNADKVFLTLEDGSVNSLTSGKEYSEEAISEKIDGTIYAKDDLTINGSGRLIVKADYQHGIVANDDLVITNGNIDITAVKDTIHVNEHYKMENANLTLEAGDDGITCDKDILICSGTVLINKCYEGIEAKNIEILDGDITIYPSDDGINANGGSNSFGGDFGGGPDNDNSFGGGPRGQREGNQNPPDMGEMQDFGNMQGPPDMGEKPDFGNMQGPPDMKNMPDVSNVEDSENKSDKQTSKEQGEEIPKVSISGGNIIIINTSGVDADGIDSNGDIIISGGNIFVCLNGTGQNNALDYGSESGGKLEITGGTVLALGGSSMLEGFSDTSTQPSFIKVYQKSTSKDSKLIITNANGEELINKQIPCGFTALSFSCPQLHIGDKVTIKVGDNSDEVSIDEMTNEEGVMGGFGFGPFERKINSKMKVSIN